MDNSLRQDFVKRTLAALENLIERARRRDEAGNFSADFRRETFRSLHTIKGTAQTIGFNASGKLAHELENLLAADVQTKSSAGENRKTLFVEGLENLKKTFEETDFEISRTFLERLESNSSSPASNQIQANLGEMPGEFSRQLTNVEKSTVAAALQNEKKIFCVEIHFDTSNFADEFTNFRQALCEKCEIIATLPAAAKQNDAAESDEIGFQILIATADDIAETVEKNCARIVFKLPPDEASNRLKSVLSQAATHGEILAERLGKQIEFEIAADDDVELAPEPLKNVFDVLTHLIRNAVDHAIETPAERGEQNKSPRATVKIEFAARGEEFYIRVADDGRGIGVEKIKTKAIEKKLISSDENLSDGDALRLIFLPEFSTRETTTEISGRGVGLDAVKDIIEKMNGKIGVETESGKGTTFEIFLPRAAEKR